MEVPRKQQYLYTNLRGIMSQRSGIFMSKVCYHLFICELLFEWHSPFPLDTTKLHTSAFRVPPPCAFLAAFLSSAAKNHPAFVAAYLCSLCVLPSHLSALSVLCLPVDMVHIKGEVLTHALLHGSIYTEKHCHQY
jgi:hypothetical protein